VLNADIGKRDMRTYFFLGNSLRKLGDHWGAADAYLKALNSPDAGGKRGKDLDYALTSRLLMADSLFDAGRFSDALEIYEMVSIDLPGDEQIRWAAYRIGWCYEMLGLQGKAMAAYSKLMGGEKDFWAAAAGERIAGLSWSARLGKVVR
jgi:tetratricopeptide (TPR) repeat protein